MGQAALGHWPGRLSGAWRPGVPGRVWGRGGCQGSMKVHPGGCTPHSPSSESEPESSSACRPLLLPDHWEAGHCPSYFIHTTDIPPGPMVSLARTMILSGGDGKDAGVALLGWS